MAGRRRRPGPEEARPSAISETELTWSQGPSPTGVEVLESQSGAVIRHRRAFAVGAVVVLLIAAITLYLTRPQPQPPVPTPWPAERSVVMYQGTQAAQDPTGRTADFVISVHDLDVAPVTIIQIDPSYPGLTLRTDPRLPLAVQPGQTVRVRLITTATDCSRIPVADALPFIDVTFRNMRAIGQESEILGDRYTLDLHRAMTAACRRE